MHKYRKLLCVEGLLLNKPAAQRGAELTPVGNYPHASICWVQSCLDEFGIQGLAHLRIHHSVPAQVIRFRL